jgi:hypothetical protein
MKKRVILFLSVIAIFLFFGIAGVEATTETESPFPLGTPDRSITFDVTQVGGNRHAIIFFNEAADTASATVLDSSGNPDNSLFGNAFFAVDFALTPDVALSPYTVWGTPDETSLFTSPYPAEAPDQIRTFNAGEVNGFNHALIFYNKYANTAMAVILDPNGVPDSFYLGAPFFAADFNTPETRIWSSKNGRVWYCSEGCPK